MERRKRILRRMVLSKLYDYLTEQYTMIYSREMFVEGSLALGQIDALLAFKSDPYLEELRRALDRVADGSYGFCLRCKKSIQRGALEIDPVRRLCATCEWDFNHAEYHGVNRYPLH